LNEKLVALLIIAFLVGAGIGYSASLPQISALQLDVSGLESEISTLTNEYDDLNTTYNQLKDDYSNLNNSYNDLLRAYEQLRSFFFFQDPEFLYGLGSDEIKWEGSSWNFSSRFTGDSNIQEGLATLFYNESTGDEWGGTVLVQGKLPHKWGKHLQPLEGTTKANAKPVEYVMFENKSPIPEGKFLLKVKVMVTERSYTVFGSYGEAVSNVGVDLMFGFDNANYNDPDVLKQVAIHADVILSRVAWDNSTKTESHTSDQSVISPSPYDNDTHLTLIRGQITQLDTWHTFEIDLAEIINTIFSLTKKETIRFYGAQVYTDGIGSYTTAIFNYVETTVDQ